MEILYVTKYFGSCLYLLSVSAAPLTPPPPTALKNKGILGKLINRVDSRMAKY